VSRVLVTGAASGLGEAIARAFVEVGARVHVNDIDAASLEHRWGEVPGVSLGVADVGDDGETAALVDEAVRTMGGLDVLINNAGVSGPTAAVEDVDPARWRRTLDVDITGMFLCTRAAVPHLKAAGSGSIVNMSSAAGRMGFPLRSPYAAAKWAVVGFTKTISIELGPFDINVNCLQPGPIPGERMDRVMADKAAARGVALDDHLAERLEHVSMRRFVSAADVASMAVYLCSPAGHSISGQAIAIDGDQRVLS
jgi:NAD(P)-dependent dehydrogenase (short-subunit alcohol dehydrogenase family)